MEMTFEDVLSEARNAAAEIAETFEDLLEKAREAGRQQGVDDTEGHYEREISDLEAEAERAYERGFAEALDEKEDSPLYREVAKFFCGYFGLEGSHWETAIGAAFRGDEGAVVELMIKLARSQK